VVPFVFVEIEVMGVVPPITPLIVVLVVFEIDRVFAPLIVPPMVMVPVPAVFRVVFSTNTNGVSASPKIILPLFV